MPVAQHITSVAQEVVDKFYSPIYSIGNIFNTSEQELTSEFVERCNRRGHMLMTSILFHLGYNRITIKESPSVTKKKSTGINRFQTICTWGSI